MIRSHNLSEKERSRRIARAVVSAVAGMFMVLATAGQCYAQLANLQITPTGAPTGACSGTIFTPAQFNNSSNWGNATGKIGNGTQILVCGTFTGGAGTGELTFQGGGASGNPIVMSCDTGTNFTAPYWGYSGNAAIVVNGFNYITLNGAGCTIQNTQNGSGLAHAAASTGIYVNNTTGVTVENFTIENLCQHTSFADTVGCQTSSVWDASILASSNSNFTVQGNTISNTNTAIEYACGSSDANLTFTQNTITSVNWGVAVGLNGSATACANAVISDNNISNLVTWDSSVPTAFHHDPIIVYVGSGTATIPSPLINANKIHGDNGLDATAWIFVQQNTGTIVPIITNNLLDNSATPLHAPNDGFIYIPSGDVYSNTIFCNNLTLTGIAGSAIQRIGKSKFRA